MAHDYADQPVLFIEYDIDNAPSSRYGRWWAAYGGGSVYLPLTMVDSGQQISHGWLDFYSVYGAMVDTALARPPQVNVEAYAWRTGNRVNSYVQVTNLSPATLSASTNAATVHAVVYEDAHVGVTDRFARAAVQESILELAPGATAAFRLQTPDLNNVNWGNLHYVALVDYRPGGSVGAFDMLQAAVAPILTGPFAAQPDSCTFLINPSDPVVPQRSVTLEGLPYLNWTAAADAPWLTITPSNGPMTTVPVISVIRDQLSAGWQEGRVTFTTEDGLYSDQVIVRAYLGPVKRAYLPVVLRGPAQ